MQWDTSDHDWLEGRGQESLYLIHMIDDATSKLTARFVRHDSTEENMRLLWFYLEQHGRPAAFYTDKAGIFQYRSEDGTRRASTGPRRTRTLTADTDRAGVAGVGDCVDRLPTRRKPRGEWNGSFDTAQDRLVKGLRVAGARTLEEANGYLAEDFLPWWNQHLVIAPANATDAHRALSPEHNLAASLSEVETRQIEQRLHPSGGWQVPAESSGSSICAGLRGATVRMSGDWMAAWPCVSATATWSTLLAKYAPNGRSLAKPAGPNAPALPRKPSAANAGVLGRTIRQTRTAGMESQARSIAPAPSTTWRSKAQAGAPGKSRPGDLRA